MPLLQQDRLEPMPRIPMTTDETNDDHAAWYAAAVGARLRSVRRQKRLSLQAVEASSAQEFKASVLGAYERGERSISVPRLQRLALLYDVPVDQLLPPDDATMTRWGAAGTTEEVVPLGSARRTLQAGSGGAKVALGMS